MPKIQHYGIKFPFNKKDYEGTFVDLDKTRGDSIKSQIMHLIFTPMGERLRRPLFGSKLIQFIFNPNDAQTFGDVKNEIKEMIKRNIPNCTLDDIKVYDVDSGQRLIAQIKYSVTENGSTTQYDIMTNL